jgi:hypothetical protein
MQTDEQQQQFTSWLDSDVRSTAEAISWVEQQFGLSYSESGMRKLLKRLDYRYKQPSILPAKADVEAQAAWSRPTRQTSGFDAPWQNLVFSGIHYGSDPSSWITKATAYKNPLPSGAQATTSCSLNTALS